MERIVQTRQAGIRTSIATLDNFEFNASHKNAVHQTNLTLTGPLLWQQNKGLQSSSINLTTLQDTVNHLPNPRFISQLTGSFNWNGKETGKGFQRHIRPPAPCSCLQISTNGRRISSWKPGLPCKTLIAPIGMIYRQTPDQATLQSSTTAQSQELMPVLKSAIQIPGLQLDNIETPAECRQRTYHPKPF